MSEDAELHVLFEDADVLAINKPGGLATQAPRQFISLEAQVRAYLRTRDPQPHEPYLGIPHRLDRCVSGVVLLAKRVKAARRLSRQFERREVGKSYVALVEGSVDADRGTWRDCVRKVPDQPRAEIVTADHPDARTAVLHYEILGRSAGATWLRIELETGRMHQIRVQAATRGFPILGDAAYGSRLPFGPAEADVRKRWIALHARELSFEHPRSRERVELSSPLPACWPSLV